MKRSTNILAGALFAAVTLFATGAATAQAADYKIGFVNTERLFREAAPAKRAQEKLEKEFAARDAEIQKMAKQVRDLQALLAFLNNNPPADQAFTDLLSSIGTIVPPPSSAFAITGDSVSRLLGGESQGGFSGVFEIQVLTRAIDADQARRIIDELEEHHGRAATGEEE